MRLPSWIGATIKDLLYSRAGFAVGHGRVPVARIATVTVIAGFTYGLAMGSFGLRPAQMFFSAVKVPLLLAVTTLIALPSFFAVNASLGLAGDFLAALRGILVSQATMAVCLAALLPLTVIAYVSSADYRFALNFNGLPFLVASLAAHNVLSRHYAPLIAKNRSHAVARAVWLALYIFVAIQLAWTLRPFVGEPSLPSAFYRKDAWSNAYVEVLEDIANLVRRRGY